jgi:hypothetical protein
MIRPFKLFALGLLAAGFVFGAVADEALAQLPLPPPPTNNGARAPDDSVEGVIFEYKGTFKRGDAPEEEVLEGKFRLEKTAIFDVGGTFRAPSAKELEKIKDKILSGKGGAIPLPPKPQQKRLGQFTKTGGNKLRLEFDDKESMNGTMLLYKNKTNADTFVGTFAEKEGTKVVRTWQVTVRPIED